MSSNNKFIFNGSTSFDAGATVTLYNNAFTEIDIESTANAPLMLRFAGSSVAGSRKLAANGIATIICIDRSYDNILQTMVSSYIISGSGLS